MMDDESRELLDRVRAVIEERDALRAVEDDLRALVAEADRVPGGMHVPWCHDLSGATRAPSIVRWARRALADIDRARGAR